MKGNKNDGSSRQPGPDVYLEGQLPQTESDHHQGSLRCIWDKNREHGTRAIFLVNPSLSARAVLGYILLNSSPEQVLLKPH